MCTTACMHTCPRACTCCVHRRIPHTVVCAWAEGCACMSTHILCDVLCQVDASLRSVQRWIPRSSTAATHRALCMWECAHTPHSTARAYAQQHTLPQGHTAGMLLRVEECSSSCCGWYIHPQPPTDESSHEMASACGIQWLVVGVCALHNTICRVRTHACTSHMLIPWAVGLWHAYAVHTA